MAFLLWTGLEIQTAGEGRRRRFLLCLCRTYRVGSGLTNDILLLDAQVPREAGVLKREGQTWVWVSHPDGRKITVPRKGLSVGPFVLRLRVSRLSFWTYALILALGSAGHILLSFE